MASVSMNGKQCKCDMGKALYGIPAHNYRTKKNHANKDIDPIRSHLNKHYGPQTVQEFRERLKEMITECDKRHPPRRRKKDRKVMLELDIVSPREGMSPEDAKRWSEATAEVIYGMFGDAVVGGTYHADEMHKYIDPHDKQEHLSREHTHWSIVPWTEEYGLNMDKFYNRDLPNRINAELDKKCMELFGYAYRDGSQRKSKGTVEQLKLESTIAEREQVEGQVQYAKDTLETVELATQEERETLQAAQEEADRLTRDNNTLRGQNDALQAQNEALRTDNAALVQSNEALRTRNNALESKAKAAEQKADAAESRLAKAQGAFARFRAAVSEWVSAYNSLQQILRIVKRLSDANRDKVERRMDDTAMRGSKAITRASESIEDMLKAEQEVERGTREFQALKMDAKEDRDPDDRDELELD